jgi:hypothetical protein
MMYTTPQRTLQEDVVVPRAFLANFTLSTRRDWHGWDVSASCYNIFNRQTFSPVGTDLAMPMVEQDGRSFRIQLSYHLILHRESKVHE